MDSGYDPLVPGADHTTTEPALCGLPGCGGELFIVHTGNIPIYTSDTAGTLADLRSTITREWHVECSNGHTILLPPDDGMDSHTFGECLCEPGKPEQACGHNDLARLRQVIRRPE
jgi:hypothetical protein